jgi:steroid delta-isomerase-like uncharacterized protein
MPIEESKAIVRRFFEQVWNKGNLDVIDETHADGYVLHDPTGDIQGTEGLKQFVMVYRTAFPDFHVTIEDEIAEGDMVVLRWTVTGTHKAELMGIPPTNKRVTMTGITMGRIASRKILEAWNSLDALGMMQQLGVIPTPGQTG